MAASKGNQNASKDKKGIQINFYLKKDQVLAIRARADHELSDQEVRDQARELAKNGIELAVQGLANLCSVKGCYWVAEITCNIGSCAPATKWCAYHYEQAHLSEDERDEIDAVTGEKVGTHV